MTDGIHKDQVPKRTMRWVDFTEKKKGVEKFYDVLEGQDEFKV